jgi:hypothetical protein
MPQSDQVGPTRTVLANILDSLDDDLQIVLTQIESVTGLVDALGDSDSEPTITLLTDEPTASQIRRNFYLATRLVDHIDAGILKHRSLPADVLHLPSLVVGPARLISLLPCENGTLAAVETENDDLQTIFAEEFDTLWAAADAFPFRTPGYTQVLTTLGDTMGEEMERDFTEALANDDIQAEFAAGLDPVDVLILIAAKRREQLYTLSRWGERIGLASPGKFSQVKQRLEEDGVIATEKIPQAVADPANDWSSLIRNPKQQGLKT